MDPKEEKRMLFKRKKRAEEGIDPKEAKASKESEGPFEGGTASQIGFHLNGASSVKVRDYPEEGFELGSFHYPSDKVKRIEVVWEIGDIRLIEKESETLCCSEKSNRLSPEATMRHNLDEDGVLHIEFGKRKTLLYFLHSEVKNLALEIPFGIDLDISNGSGDVLAETLDERNVDISTSSGDVEIGDIHANELGLSTSSGGISINKACIDGSVNVSSSSGDVSFSNIISQSLDVNTSSGDVDVALVSSGGVDISTASGDVKTRLPLGGAHLAFVTASGDLSISKKHAKGHGSIVIGDGEIPLNITTASGDCIIS